MKRKAKGEKIELLYTKTEEKNKKAKNKKTKIARKNVRAASSRPQKNDNNTISLDNEIIIGLTPRKVESKKTNNKAKTVKGDASVRSQKNNRTGSKKQAKSKSVKKVGSSSGKNKKQSELYDCRYKKNQENVFFRKSRLS